MDTELSPAQLYAICLETKEPSHYTRIPNIIDHLTYNETDETGKTVKKKLSIHAKTLYRIIKTAAGEHGVCWQNRDTLADLCGMSTGSVTNAKKELTQNFNELDGKPLIKITCRTKKTSNKVTTYHTMVVLDIWNYNRAFMSTRKYLKPVEALDISDDEALSDESDSNIGSMSPHDSDKPPLSPHDSDLQGSMSPHDTNKNNVNKIYLYKEQTEAAHAAPSVLSAHCSLDKEDNVPADDRVDKKTKAFNWLKKFGCDTQAAIFLAENTPYEDLKNASLYVEKQNEKKRAKGQCIPNPIGYLRNTLANRYWEKKYT